MKLFQEIIYVQIKERRKFGEQKMQKNILCQFKYKTK